jgi:hypothetical protein
VALSRGPGRTERFVYVYVTGFNLEDGWGSWAPLQRGEGLPLLWLAELYAHQHDLAFSRGVIETVRRAIHSLERKGLVSSSVHWAPSASPNRHGGHRARKMLLVGQPGQRDGLAPVHMGDMEPLKARVTSPPNYERRPARVSCINCGEPFADLKDLLQVMRDAGLDDEAKDRATDTIVERTPATVMLRGMVAEGYEDRVVRSDLCYGCWLDRR